MIVFKLNGKRVQLDLDPEMPLLWALRDHLQLTGTKFGCGGGYCGACTVHLGGQAARSCQLQLAAVQGREVRTIEAFGTSGQHPVQQAWSEVNVAQCGYCQTGQIMTAIALLEQNPSPSDAEINGAMNGNLCRCGSYPRIRKAIKLAISRQT
jgi:aerobic-type carbon monoxide dehydrogenase small subunit (CoxS/CutS family)